MFRSLLVIFPSVVLWILPSACFAQAKNSANNTEDAGTVALPNPSSAVVSVHELKIPGKARDACNKGTKRFAAKDAAGSIPEFQEAIKDFPEYYEAYAKLGAAEFDLEQWANAEAAFRKSIELSAGRYAPANFGLALILATVTNQFAEAESVVRTGLAMDPADVTGHFVLGWVLYSTARLEEAEKSAREAVVAQPNFAGARLLLAQIHLRQNEFAAVIQDLDTYLALGIAGPLDEKVRAVRAEALRALSGADANPELAQSSR